MEPCRLCSREDSNLDFMVRSHAFYPLNYGNVLFIVQASGDSNSRPAVLETAMLPITPETYILSSNIKPISQTDSHLCLRYCKTRTHPSKVSLGVLSHYTKYLGTFQSMLLNACFAFLYVYLADVTGIEPV